MAGLARRAWLLGALAAFSATTLLSRFASTTASSVCRSFTSDALLDRVHAHLSLCLPAHSSAFDGFHDALNANELEARAPLSLVAFSTSSDQLKRLASALASAVVAEGSSSTSLPVRVIDFTTLLRHGPQAPSNHELRQRLRQEMVSTLTTCPQQRTLFVVRGLEAVRGERLSLLDVFLDPMNGARALLHDQQTNQDLDCRRALFVFLYQLQQPQNQDEENAVARITKTTWRDFLVAQWKHDSEAAATTQDVTFTPQALAGRLTTAVQLHAAAVESEIPQKQECDWEALMERWRIAQRHHDDEQRKKTETRAVATGTGVAQLGDRSPWSPQQRAGAFGFALVFVALLVAAKRFVASSKEMEEVVLIQQQRRLGEHRNHQPPSAGRDDDEDDDDGGSDAVTMMETTSVATYSLRSRTVVAATTPTTTAETAPEPNAPSSSSTTSTKSMKSPSSKSKKSPKSAVKRPSSADAIPTNSQRSHSQTTTPTPPPAPAPAPPPTPTAAAATTAGTTTMKSPTKRRTRRATRS